MGKASRELLMELLDYSPDTEVFTWRTSKKSRKAGSVAGSLGKGGYWFITHGQNIYRAHRLAWLFVHGDWPSDLIDHINRDRADNRICNLRLATKSQNNINSVQERKNSSGVVGVSHCSQTGRWKAQIGCGGKMISLGRFDSIEEAYRRRKQAEKELFGEFSPEPIKPLGDYVQEQWRILREQGLIRDTGESER